MLPADYIVVLQYMVATPHFIPPIWKHHPNTQIFITCATLNSDIYYTLDGSDPTQDSFHYTESFNIAQTGPVTVKARAYRVLWYPSEIGVTTYTVGNM